MNQRQLKVGLRQVFDEEEEEDDEKTKKRRTEDIQSVKHQVETKVCEVVT